jgi:hypothetical protein
MQPQRNNTSLIIAAVIVGCIIIAAALLVVLPRDNVDGTNDGTNDEGVFSHGVREGDHVDYKMTLTSGSTSATGTCRISYSNVTETSMTRTIWMSVNGYTNTTSEVINLNENVWETEGSGSAGSGDSSGTSSTSVIGTETIQTRLGSKECVHTRIVTSNFVEDDWSNSVCILKATITYTSGQQIFMEIFGTNVSDI